MEIVGHLGQGVLGERLPIQPTGGQQYDRLARAAGNELGGCQTQGSVQAPARVPGSVFSRLNGFKAGGAQLSFHNNLLPGAENTPAARAVRSALLFIERFDGRRKIGQIRLHLRGFFHNQGNLQGGRIRGPTPQPGGNISVELAENEVLPLQPNHGTPLAVFHRDFDQDVGKIQRIDTVDLHEKAGVKGGHLGQDVHLVLVEIYDIDLSVWAYGQVSQVAGEIPQIAERSPGLLPQVIVEQFAAVYHQQVIRVEKGDPLRSAQDSLAKAVQKIATVVIHDNSLAAAVGDEQLFFSAGNSRGAAQRQTRAPSDGKHEIPGEVVLVHPSVPPVAHVQISSAVGTQVLGTEQLPRSIAPAADEQHPVATEIHLLNLVSPVFGNKHEPLSSVRILRFQTIVGAIETAKAPLKYPLHGIVGI